MKAIIVSIIVAGILIGGSVMLTRNIKENTSVVNENNVTIVDGKQIIQIAAKGGYLPIKSIAKANIPTTLRVNTDGTFDCSASIRIPSMDVSKNLEATSTTDIDLGNPKIGLLQGTCGMGMYPFEIEFIS